MAAGGTAGTNTGVGGTGGTSPGGGAGADASGGLGAGGAFGGGGGGGGGFGFTGGGGGSSGAYQHLGNPGGNVSQPFTFTNSAGSIISGGIGGRGNTLYGSGGGGGGGAGVGGGGAGGGGGYGVGGGGGGGGGGAGVGSGGGSGGYGASGVGGSGGSITGIGSITNNGKIYGGAGAAGVNYSLNPAQHGTAGNGGDAIGYGGGGGLGGGTGGPGGVGGRIAGPATTIINTGLLQGGSGGAPSPGLTIGGGVGGVGVHGSNLTIVNSGTIAGGFDGNTGTVRSNAILFTAGTNSLELQSGWMISGNVGNASGVAGTTNTLILGGNATNLSGNGTSTGTVFDVSQIGVKYQNFDAFQKSGVSVWQLTSVTVVVTPWTITGGTLQIGSDAALGSTSSTFTFGGTDADTGLPGSGTLMVTANTASTRNIVLNSIAGFANTIQVGSGVTYTTTSGVISGAGALTKTGVGTLVLNGNNTYAGGTTIIGGTVQISNDAGLGNTNGTLTFGGTDAGTGLPGSGTLAVTGTTSTTRTVVLNNIAGFANTIDVNGTNTYTIGGAISGQGALTKANSGTLTLTARNTYGGGTTISAGTLQLGNGGTSGSILGNVADNGTLAFNRADTVTFTGVISGTGGVNQIGPGTTILDAKNTYAGPTNVTAGTLVVGDAGTPSASLSGGGLVAVANGATLGGFGSVAGSVANSGTFSVGNALPAFAGGPNTTFNVGGNVTNAGLITLVGATPGNTLKVGGNFVGVGGTLALKTLLNGGGPLSNQSTDRLLVGGNADPTAVRITPVGTGAFTAVNFPTAQTGISIVQVAGMSSVGAFTLAGGTVSSGLYVYNLYAYGPGSPSGPADPSQTLIGAPGTNWDYRLQNVFVTAAGPAPPLPAPAPGAPPPPPPPGARPQVAPQVPAYISAPTVLFAGGLQDINELHRRLGEIRDVQASGEPQQFETFVRAYGGPYQYSSTRSFGAFGFNFKDNDDAIQFGGSRIVMNDDRGQLRVGLAGTFGQSFFTPNAVDGSSSGSFNTEKLSGIATYQARSGLYVDAIVTGGAFNGHVTTGLAGRTASLKGTLVGLSLEIGYPMQIGWQDLVAEPEVQVTWQHLNFSPRTDVSGVSVNIGGHDQGVARVGGRLVRPFQVADGTLLSPYLKANLLQGLGDGSAITLSGSRFGTGSYGTALQFGGGVTGTAPSGRVAAFGDVAYQRQVGNGGVRGWTFTGGLRLDF